MITFYQSGSVVLAVISVPVSKFPVIKTCRVISI